MEEIVCFDRVVVSEPVVSGERVHVDYALHRKGRKTARGQLLLHYPGHDLEDSPPPGLAPLVRLAAVQPVVSLGPFAREIALEFPVEAREMSLLRDIFRSVAREIYLNRILPGGACLKARPGSLAFAARKSYCQAKLVARLVEERAAASRLPEDRFAVLLTRAPESLLAYGILRELGVGLVPIVPVEDPREARGLAPIEKALQTGGVRYARVTSNHAPLALDFGEAMRILNPKECRKDPHASPLGTYLEGPPIFFALPVMSCERVGYLAVAKHPRPPTAALAKGVVHYSGLYDRTRYFDDLLARAFAQRGWAFHPFTLTLSVSELVVQRILGTRYPDLFPLQLACASPVRSSPSGLAPCGRCEACGATLAVLLAEGLDPAKIGVRDRDVERFLKRGPPSRPGREELIQHASFKMVQRGVAPSQPAGEWAKITPRAHPHLEKICFDNRRSFLDTIPVGIRRRVYRILLEHARGAAVSAGEGWSEFNLLESKEVDREKVLF